MLKVRDETVGAVWHNRPMTSLDTVRPNFAHVTDWVFDLDNTLYNPSVRLFDQIEVRMTAYVMSELGIDQAEANRLRQHQPVTAPGIPASHSQPDTLLSGDCLGTKQ